MKKVILFVGLSLLLVMTVGIYKMKTSFDRMAGAGNVVPDTRHDAPELDESSRVDESTLLPSTEDALSASAPLPSLSKEQREEIEAWNLKHGYFDYYRDYGRLSVKDLTDLAQAGDIGAFHALAAKFALDDPNRAIGYYNEAANRGSTYALLLIGELYMFHAGSEGALSNSSQAGGAEVQALAYSFAAQILGDNTAAGFQAERILEGNRELLLSEDRREDVCTGSRNIVEKIRQFRESQGYTRLDRSVQPYARQFSEQASFSSVCDAG
jgi:hypothetical protein